MDAHPWDIAAPSRALPGNPAEAARFLASKVKEVDLCCYFTKECLAWGEAELPPNLTQLPVTWHVHLPVDLPWREGAAAAANAAATIWRKTQYLNPRFGVLHVPQGEPQTATALLREFFAAWQQQGLSSQLILLENIKNAPNLAQKTLAQEVGAGICLDVAHAMSFGQTDSLDDEEFLSMVRLVHWSAPSDADRHLPLEQWDATQRAVAQKAAKLVPASALHVLEVFEWPGFVASWPVFCKLMAAAGRRD